MMPKYIVFESCTVQKEERTAQRHTCISAFLYKSRTHAFYCIKYDDLSGHSTLPL